MKKITNVMAVAGLLLTTSTGVAFAEEARGKDNGGNKNTPIDLFLDLATDGGGNAKSTPNNNSELNTINGSGAAEKAWGFAYKPKQKGASDRLAEEGPQQLQVLNQGAGEKNNTTNIAVKNRTRNKGSWSLQAKLSGDSLTSSTGQDKISGLKVTLTEPKVQEVKDDEDGSASKLIPVEEEAVNLGVIGVQKDEEGQKIELNSSPSTLINGSDQVVQNGIYDFGFKKATIDIPEVKRIQDGGYSGLSVTWTLSNTPGAAAAAE